MKSNVFLGGACGTTTWRQDIAIPALEAAGLSYFNPQLGVGEWTEECEYIEQQAKEEASILLFVINGQTRGVASLAEAAYCISEKRPLVLVLSDVEKGHEIEGSIISDAECRDLNRGRFYVQAMAEMHLIPVFKTVEAALQHIINAHCTSILLPALQDGY
ncbi:MAG: nucleoside 2-deoxyribosyltransferase domain-containing protein [Cyanobacteria bacterium P01_F01_bin.150]